MTEVKRENAEVGEGSDGRIVIELNNVGKSFGGSPILRGVNLTAEEGSILGLVGINGAGKSTLLRLIAGVLEADCGEIKVNGENVFDNPAVKARMFFLSDDPYYNTTLTADAQAKFYSTFYEFDYEAYNGLMKKFALDEKKQIKNFSKGMKRQAFVSLALACRPKVLLLDEAFDGLDPLARLEFKRGLVRLQEGGSTILISSHSLRELEDICDSFALIDGQTVKAFGKIDAELGNLCKLQLAFAEPLTEKDIPFECLHFEASGRVVRVVARGDRGEILKKVKALDPLIIDEIPMDFEDMFIYEVENRGYVEK